MNKDSSSSQGGSMVRFRLLPAVNGSNIFDAVHDPSPGFRNTVCEVGQQLLMIGTGNKNISLYQKNTYAILNAILSRDLTPT